MKVKITHTVDYDEIPAIISKMVLDCRERLKKASMFSFNMRNLKNATIEIIQVQNDLDLISSKLEDCLNISAGYEEAYSSTEYTETVSERQEDTNENDN